MVQIDNLCKTFGTSHGEVRALGGVTLDVKAGEFIAVQGPSGCGKTTLLLALGGLLLPSAGRITVDGVNPYTLSANARARWRAQTVGFVFQQFHLVPYLDVLDNVLAASLPCPPLDGVARARALIDRFSLSHRIHHVPAELSTGERQRVALVRALLNRPKILLADEPTGNLDESNSETVLDHLAEFATEGGVVVLVTHDSNAASRADRVVYMEAGYLRSGPCEA